jgi:hypothetical protein
VWKGLIPSTLILKTIIDSVAPVLKQWVGMPEVK